MKLKSFYFIIFFLLLISCKNEKAELTLLFSKESFSTISNYREEALKNNLINPPQKKYVKIEMVYGDTSFKGKARLKGDWTDHIRTDQWSLRVKSERPIFDNNLKIFSIQHPKTRYNLYEWFIHEWAKKECVLSTPYDFHFISVDNSNPQLYAVEGHFTNQLLALNNRKVGPIFKLDEKLIWSIYGMEKIGRKLQNVPIYESANIAMYQKKYFLNNDSASLNMLIDGKEQFKRLKAFDPKIEEVIDIDKTAKMHAIVNIMVGLHGLAWHNQRWYYNPISKRLEPILFDCYSDSPPLKEYQGFVLKDTEEEKRIRFKTDYFVYQLYNHPLFLSSFYDYLKLFTSEKYQNSIRLLFELEIIQKERLFKSGKLNAHLNSMKVDVR